MANDFPRANYGPNEEPRKCYCGHTNSRVRWTETDDGTKYRHRVCCECGEPFTTTERKLE